MNILEQIIASIAPHGCITCGCKGELLCRACENVSLIPVPSQCYRCYKVTRQNATCKRCKSIAQINHVWVAARYESTAKEIIRRLKFTYARAASEVIARNLAEAIPNLPDYTLVSHIPTANNRVRVRGYDQAELIAKELCKLKGWRYQALLKRTGRTRQVGASRKERFKHQKRAFRPARSSNLSGEHVLLVDDISTTGASIEAAAKTLRNTGVSTVDVAVFAQA